MAEATRKTENYTSCQQVGYILSRCNYLATLGTITTLYFILSAISFWITDYVVAVLERSQEEAFIIYICVGALGPIIGVGFSGCIFDRMGGYRGRNTPLLFTAFVAIATVFALISVLFWNAYVVAACVLLELWFGGMTVPVLTGFMLAQVPARMRPVASSIYTLFYNGLGMFPAPSVYGIVY